MPASCDTPSAFSGGRRGLGWRVDASVESASYRPAARLAHGPVDVAPVVGAAGAVTGEGAAGLGGDGVYRRKRHPLRFAGRQRAEPRRARTDARCPAGDRGESVALIIAVEGSRRGERPPRERCN